MAGQSDFLCCVPWDGITPEAKPSNQSWSIFSPSTWESTTPISTLVETLSATASLATQTEETHSRVDAQLARSGVPYLRLQPPDAGMVDLNATHEAAFKFLMRQAENMLQARRSHRTDVTLFTQRFRDYPRCSTLSVDPPQQRLGTPLPVGRCALDAFIGRRSAKVNCRLRA